MSNLFIKTEKQKKWLDKLQQFEEKFKSRSAEIDELSVFPIENMKN